MELREILKQTENEYVEFKQVGEFSRNYEIAKLLVAFTNRDGGKLIFGVRDNGTLEGKRINFDEKAKIITNIATNLCTPQIQFSSFRFSLKEGDVFVIDIKKRKDIPHAVIINKKIDKENYKDSITGRAYYIRTISGIRAIDDKELEWLFRSSEGLDIEEGFNIILMIGIKTSMDLESENRFITKHMLLVPSYGQYQYDVYLSQLSDEVFEKIILNEKNEKKIELGLLLYDILPLIIIDNLSRHYKNTTMINITGIHPITTTSKEDKGMSEKIIIDVKSFFENLNIKGINSEKLLIK